MPCPFHFVSKGTAISSEKEKKTATTTESVETPTRRKLLKGMLGAAGGALAYSGITQAATHGTMPEQMQSMDTSDAFMSEQKIQPFYGMHQSGIATPQQANVALLACDVLAQNKADLQRLFKTLTARSEFLMNGGHAPTRDDKYPPLDSGMLGPKVHPDNLTITVSVGASLFDDRYGLAPLKPLHLQRMTEFPNDGLQSQWCHGDLMIQICANSPDTTLHAVRDIVKHTPDTLTVRWRRDGFISPHAAASMGKRTPINLLGFKDGTVNPPADQADTFNKVVWVGPHNNEPAWAAGGSYQAIRLIRFFVEHWDRTPLQEQEAIFGRDRDTGAPLGMKHEHDDPYYTNDPEGKRIPLTSHMRLANPRTADFPEFLLLRRGYSYSYNATPSGQLDVGLMFIAYQANLETGFIATQNRLNGEELEEYIKPFGGGYFFTLPGVKHAGEYFAQHLLEAV